MRGPGVYRISLGTMMLTLLLASTLALAEDPPPEDSGAINVTVEGIALRIPAGIAIEIQTDGSVEAEVEGAELTLDGDAVTIPEGPGGATWAVALQSKDDGFVEISANAGTTEVKWFEQTLQVSIDDVVFRLDGADGFELLPSSNPFEISSDSGSSLVDPSASQQLTATDGLYSWTISVVPARGGYVHITMDVGCTAHAGCDAGSISCSATGPNAHCQCSVQGGENIAECNDGRNFTRCRQTSSSSGVCDTQFIGPMN